jgi:2-succinyl-5-enolpyruvyl-6-hydroxy-3-cyclohexene-1-carboxylate synthase
MDQNINTEWCRAVAGELLQLGIRDVVICPGGRSAAMVAALRECKTLRFFVQTDERSAGFFALGLALSTKRAAAICVTSGSAVANLVPVLSEAYAVAAPLLVLSCDRPRHLRGAGFSQMTKQVEFCAPLVAATVDLDDPTAEPDDLRQLRSKVASLGRHLRPGPLQGPVQLNIPLSGRMTSVDGMHGWTSGPPTREAEIAGSADVPSEEQAADLPREVDAIATALGLRRGLKGLIVTGPDCGLDPELVGKLARVTGFPLIADAVGSFRGAGIAATIAEADILVTRPPLAQLKPDLVIRLGSAPVFHTLQQYLENAGTRVLRIDRRPVERDFLAPSFQQLTRTDAPMIQAIAEVMSGGDEGWRETWVGAARRCRNGLNDMVAGMAWGEIQAVTEAVEHPEFKLVHVANSLPIRLLNLLMPTSSDRRVVFANRGVSGIDGTFGTFLGELAGSGRRGLLLIGDLAAIHDIPALEACLRGTYRGAIVILNNAGAGLFDLLPTRGLPEYERLIRNHRVNIDFGSVARAFALEYTLCHDRASFRSALTEAGQGDRLRVIEAVVPEKGAASDLPRLFIPVA